MAKNPMEKILARLRDKEAGMQSFTAAGTNVQVGVTKDGKLDLDKDVLINGRQMGTRTLLHAAAIVQAAGKGGKNVCLMHGVQEANNMGCESCRREIADGFNAVVATSVNESVAGDS